MVPELTETDEIVSGYVAAHELQKLVHSEALLLLGPYLSIECLVGKNPGIKSKYLFLRKPIHSVHTLYVTVKPLNRRNSRTSSSRCCVANAGGIVIETSEQLSLSGTWEVGREVIALVMFVSVFTFSLFSISSCLRTGY